MWCKGEPLGCASQSTFSACSQEPHYFSGGSSQKKTIKMNHGYCKNCWWNKETKPKFTIVTSEGLKEFPSEGKCFMHNKMVNGNSYCPDYTNKKKEEKHHGPLEKYFK